MNYITIPELSAKTKLSVNSIRFQLYKNKIDPIDTVKWQINGYTGKPFKKEDVEKVISSFVPQSERIKNAPEEQKEVKRYSHKQVCEVLRKNIKSTLCNKMVSVWNYQDWKEFESLINPML